MKTDITSIELPSSLLVIDKSAFAESEILRVDIQRNSKLQKIFKKLGQLNFRI